MNRVVILATVSLIMAVAFVWIGPSSTVTGQDQSEERIEALETHVATLEDRVEELEDADLVTSGGSSEAGESDPGGAGEIALSGSGKTATEPMALDGAYEVAATCDGGFIFTVDIVNVTNRDSFEFINLVGEVPFAGSAVATFKGDRYAFTVNCDSDWTLTFTPLS